MSSGNINSTKHSKKQTLTCINTVMLLASYTKLCDIRGRFLWKQVALASIMTSIHLLSTSLDTCIDHYNIILQAHKWTVNV